MHGGSFKSSPKKEPRREARQMGIYGQSLSSAGMKAPTPPNSGASRAVADIIHVDTVKHSNKDVELEGGCILLPDNATVRCPDSRGPCVARWNYPMTFQVYFEVVVVRDCSSVCIGITSRNSPLRGHVGIEVAPNSKAYGYLSKEGCVLLGRPGGGMDRGVPFTAGDVVGCGLLEAKNELIFTKNGRVVRSISGIINPGSRGSLGGPVTVGGDLLPTISVQGAGTVARLKTGDFEYTAANSWGAGAGGGVGGVGGAGAAVAGGPGALGGRSSTAAGGSRISPLTQQSSTFWGSRASSRPSTVYAPGQKQGGAMGKGAGVGAGVGGGGGGQGQRVGGGRRKRLENELGPYLVCKAQKSVKLGRDKVTICRIIGDSEVESLQESEHVLVFGRRPVPSYSPLVSPQTPGANPGLFYFEVTVFLGDGDRGNGGDVYVGFADRGICGVPGLEDPRSIAMWGRSGCLLADGAQVARIGASKMRPLNQGAHRGGYGVDDASDGDEDARFRLTTGTVVGCGIIWSIGRAFFTHNGLFSGWAGDDGGGWSMTNDEGGRLYPCVAIRNPGDSVVFNLEVNVTGRKEGALQPLRPFVFDLDQLPDSPHPSLHSHDLSSTLFTSLRAAVATATSAEESPAVTDNATDNNPASPPPPWSVPPVKEEGGAGWGGEHFALLTHRQKNAAKQQRSRSALGQHAPLGGGDDDARSMIAGQALELSILLKEIEDAEEETRSCYSTEEEDLIREEQGGVGWGVGGGDVGGYEDDFEPEDNQRIHDDGEDDEVCFQSSNFDEGAYEEAQGSKEGAQGEMQGTREGAQGEREEAGSEHEASFVSGGEGAQEGDASIEGAQEGDASIEGAQDADASLEVEWMCVSPGKQERESDLEVFSVSGTLTNSMALTSFRGGGDALNFDVAEPRADNNTAINPQTDNSAVSSQPDPQTDNYSVSQPDPQTDNYSVSQPDPQTDNYSVSQPDPQTDNDIAASQPEPQTGDAPPAAAPSKISPSKRGNPSSGHHHRPRGGSSGGGSLGLVSTSIECVPVRWKPGRLLGQGAFGRVVEGMDEETGDFLAVKEVQMHGTDRDIGEKARGLEREISIMSRLVHPNIVRYIGMQQDKDKVFIFMEVAPKGSIASVIAAYGGLSEPVVRKYAAQMLRGLHYLHSQDQPVIHRDIKGGNVLLWDNGVVKLADFGASKRLNTLCTGSRENKSMIGTPYWMAPEVIRESGHGRKADIWSMGCTFIEMLAGKPPFSEYENPITALFQIAANSKLPVMPKNASPECIATITCCLSRTPAHRPSALELLEKDAWIKQI